ncbi:MAG: hypothetical protein IKW67_01500 [Alphaproteobacteria bacterium]|nr:hypothetical protein [Alphaproteobacteria bacterium]
MFLKEAFEMTDMVKNFNLAGDSLQQEMNARELKNATVNLRDIFKCRGIFCRNNGNSDS